MKQQQIIMPADSSSDSLTLPFQTSTITESDSGNESRNDSNASMNDECPESYTATVNESPAEVNLRAPEAIVQFGCPQISIPSTPINNPFLIQYFIQQRQIYREFFARQLLFFSMKRSFNMTSHEQQQNVSWAATRIGSTTCKQQTTPDKLQQTTIRRGTSPFPRISKGYIIN
jgi:hypothetical protein